MCRWIVFVSNGPPAKLSDILSKPRHSLVSQSYHAAYHPGFSSCNNALLNADGFGCSWYAEDGRLFLFKSVSPAWSDPNLRELQEYITSRVFFGHVRAASPGSLVSHENCHPFKHGRLAFMHNGHIEGFPLLRRALLARLSDAAFHAVQGLTDSEHAFALLLSQLEDPARATPFAPAELSAALVATIAQLLELLRSAGVTGGFTSLNFALTDGATVVATRFCDQWPRIPPPSLYCALPTCEDLALELAGPQGAAAAPGDGAGAPAGGGGSGSGAAAPDSAGEAYARRASRWAACEALVQAATPTISSRALLIASEPATEGASSRVQWLAMPANALVSFTLGAGAAPALSRLEDLLSPPSGSGAAAGGSAMDRK